MENELNSDESENFNSHARVGRDTVKTLWNPENWISTHTPA